MVWYHLDSTWIIKTDDSAATIRDRLARHIVENDELLMVGLAGEAAWRGFSEKGSASHHQGFREPGATAAPGNRFLGKPLLRM